jgi:uncharacterized protein YjiS (DUF1127 family)
MENLLQRRTSTRLVVTLGRDIGRILRATYQARERSRQRRALARLSDGLLRDIGLTRHDVAREVTKPFWCA